MTDAAGTQISVSSNAVGETTGESQIAATRDGSVTINWSYQYTPNGDLIAVSGPGGQSSTKQLDAAGRPTRLTGPGRDQTVTYSAAGDLAGFSDGVAVDHDAVGRETKVTLPDGSTASYEYDAIGRRTATVLQDGTVQQTTYDAAGQVISTSQGGARETRAYDGAGRLTAVTDSNGLTTRYTYDLVGNLTEVIDGLGGVATYRYDSANRLVAATDPVGPACHKHLRPVRQPRFHNRS